MPITNSMLGVQNATNEATGIANKKELDALMNDVKSKAESVQRSKLSSEQLDQEIRQKLLTSFFDVLQAVGVDPNNLESISKFLRELEAQSPDLYELFQEAFDALSGNKISPEASSPLSKYTNLGPQAGVMPQGMPQEMSQPPSQLPPQEDGGAPMISAGPQMPM